MRALMIIRSERAITLVFGAGHVAAISLITIAASTRSLLLLVPAIVAGFLLSTVSSAFYLLAMSCRRCIERCEPCPECAAIIGRRLFALLKLLGCRVGDMPAEIMKDLARSVWRSALESGTIIAAVVHSLTTPVFVTAWFNWDPMVAAMSCCVLAAAVLVPLAVSRFFREVRERIVRRVYASRSGTLYAALLALTLLFSVALSVLVVRWGVPAVPTYIAALYLFLRFAKRWCEIALCIECLERHPGSDGLVYCEEMWCNRRDLEMVLEVRSCEGAG